MESSAVKLEGPQYTLSRGDIVEDNRESTAFAQDQNITERTKPMMVEVIWPSLEVPTAELQTGDLLKQYMPNIIFLNIEYQKIQKEEPRGILKEGTKKYFQLVEQLGEVSPAQIDKLTRENAWKQHREFF
jgi:hypothetical protein